MKERNWQVKTIVKTSKSVCRSIGSDLCLVDCRNHRVMRWNKEAKEGRIVVGGRNGKSAQSNQFNVPKGLAFDRDGNLYVADCENHRIQKYQAE